MARIRFRVRGRLVGTHRLTLVPLAVGTLYRTYRVMFMVRVGLVRFRVSVSVRV